MTTPATLRVRRTIIWVILLAPPVLGAAPGVRVARVVEDRVARLIDEPNVTVTRAELEITLLVDGLPDARKYGRIKVDEARDDLGTDLIKKPPTTAHAEAEARKPFEDTEGPGQSPGGPFAVGVELATSPRRAARVARLGGSFQVLSGEEKVVTIDKLKSRAGQSVDDPALAAAGLKLEIGKPDPDRVAEVRLKFTGNLDALGKDVEFSDAPGKSIKTGHVGATSAELQDMTYNLGKELDDSIVARVHVFVGQRTDTVPFDLKDIEIP